MATHSLFLMILSVTLMVYTSIVTALPALNITALTSRDGYSVLECWQLKTVPVEAFSALNYALGNTTRATWSIIEPRTQVGEAWAPNVQLTMILNGLIRITSPASAPISAPSLNTSNVTIKTSIDTTGMPTQHTAYILPGTLSSSILIAADLHTTSYNRGHFTEFPSNQDTVLVQVPFVGNNTPSHVVLGDGPCL